MNLYIIDGCAVFFRSYYAFIKNPLTNSNGMNISAIYGFANTILKIIQDYKPDHFIITFDHKEPTFRHQMYPEYKANRTEMPEDLAVQIPLIYDFVDSLKFKKIITPGYEADDIIGTLVKKFKNHLDEIIIVSGDKDLIQLLDQNVHLLNIKSLSKKEDNSLFKQNQIIEKYGVKQNQLLDYFALIGDSSDNIPGVSGIGPKSAQKLLNQFQNLDDIYLNAHHITSKSIKNKIINDKEKAYLSKQLVTINSDMTFDIQLKDCLLSHELTSHLSFWANQNNMHSLKKFSKTLKKTASESNQIINSTHTHIETPHPHLVTDLPNKTTESVLKLKDFIDLHDVFFLKEFENKFLLLSLKDYCLISPEDLKNNIDQLYHKKCFGFHTKKIHKEFIKHGIDHNLPIMDLALAFFILYPDIKSPQISDLLNHYNLNQSSFFTHLFEDYQLILNCHSQIMSELKHKKMNKLYIDLENPLIPVLANMELNGIQIDQDYLRHLSQTMKTEINELTLKIQNESHSNFNINSTKQLGQILFEKLKIQNQVNVKKVKKTKTGYSTSSETLEQYKSLPIIQHLLKYRILSKLLTTYVDSFLSILDPKTHRIHAEFNQMITVTGRLSSTNPNLQNIPIRTVEGQKIRTAFICEKNHILLSADYSQIELKILAHLSKDQMMQNAFLNDQDIHAQTASYIFKTPVQEVTQQQRSQAKAVNFGIIYGMGPKKLSQDTSIALKEAKSFIEEYFNIYKDVHSYIQAQIQKARESGFVQTLFGRIRHLPDISSSRPDKRVMSEHMAVNTPIQGTAADMIKSAMIKIHEQLKKNQLKTKLLLQIHDELVFEVPKHETHEIKKLVSFEMENVIQLSVPLRVNMNTGINWLEAH